MTKQLEKAILKAYLQALIMLGDDYKKMSCFYEQWKNNVP